MIIAGRCRSPDDQIHLFAGECIRRLMPRLVIEPLAGGISVTVTDDVYFLRRRLQWYVAGVAGM